MHALPVPARACESPRCSRRRWPRALRAGGHTRPNYRAAQLPFPFGVLDGRGRAAGAGSAHAASSGSPRRGLFVPEALPVAVYALGVIAPRPDRRRARAARLGGRRGARARLARPRRGRRCAASSRPGALKAAGSLGLALLAMSYLPASRTGAGCWRPACWCSRPTSFNLLDLRPGRSTEGVRAARRGPGDRRRGRAAAVGARPVRGARRSWRASTTCASGRCSATPARTCWARWRACGWC